MLKNASQNPENAYKCIKLDWTVILLKTPKNMYTCIFIKKNLKAYIFKGSH